MPQLRRAFRPLLAALRDMVPILATIGAFQFFVLGRMPDELGQLLLGLLALVVGLALFVRARDEPLLCRSACPRSETSAKAPSPEVRREAGGALASMAARKGRPAAPTRKTRDGDPDAMGFRQCGQRNAAARGRQALHCGQAGAIGGTDIGIKSSDRGSRDDYEEQLSRRVAPRIG